jgi:hypothetical protein
MSLIIHEEVRRFSSDESAASLVVLYPRAERAAEPARDPLPADQANEIARRQCRGSH